MKEATVSKKGETHEFCLAGIGGHIPSMVESAKGAKRIVAIDGCPVACSKLTLEQEGLAVTDYVVVTELAIKKNKDFTLNENELNRVCEKVIESLQD